MAQESRRGTRTRAVGAAVWVSLALAACQDQPVGPSVVVPTHDRESATAAGGLHVGQVPFVCVLTRPAPQAQFGAEARRTTIYFPRAEVAPDGRTIRYSYVRADAKQWYGAADCTIPRTEAAVRRMDRAFDAEAPGVVRTARGFGSGNLQIMGCVAEGACTVEGITVTAPPQQQQTQLTCDVNDPTCAGGASPGYRWDFSGGEYVGGGDYDGWVSNGDTDNDGDQLDEGPIAFTICVAARLGPGGWGAIVTSGISAWQLWGAHVDVRNTYQQWDEYERTYSQDGHGGNYDSGIAGLYRARYEDAVEERDNLTLLVATSAGFAAWEVAKAVGTCLPAGAAGPV